MPAGRDTEEPRLEALAAEGGGGWDSDGGDRRRRRGVVATQTVFAAVSRCKLRVHAAVSRLLSSPLKFPGAPRSARARARARGSDCVQLRQRVRCGSCGTRCVHCLSVILVSPGCCCRCWWCTLICCRVLMAILWLFVRKESV